MPAKRLPSTDEERIKIVQAIIDQEELIPDTERMLSSSELFDTRNLLTSFEGSFFCFKQATENESAADGKYIELFKTAQLYINHFIQVLNMAVIRGEIKREALSYYGFEESDEVSIPDLSTEEAVLNWGERIIKGETERTYHSGTPIYSPAIAKVKVHFDIFKESYFSLMIYRKNTLRCKNNLSEIREKIDDVIWNTWSQVEDRFWDLPNNERKKKFHDYRIGYFYQTGEQLSVFG